MLSAAWDQVSPSQASIVVSEARVKALAENFYRTWQRPPKESELAGLIEDHIRDEVLTREAQRLGLDRDDQVIRRRLRQKIEIITEEAAAAIPPTDEALNDYLNQNAPTFRSETRVAFQQIFLDPSARGDHVNADAAKLLATLNDGLEGGSGKSQIKTDPRDFAKFGDRLFILKPVYALAGQREIAAIFGAEFAAALPALPPDRWSGPIVSGYGLHLVRIDEIAPGKNPTLDEVRPLVEREWRNGQRKAAAEAQYQSLRAGYQIVVKSPGNFASGAALAKNGP